jgi:hypothetical protein
MWDRGGFFARLKALRSYCMAFKVPGGHHPRYVPPCRFPIPLGALRPDPRRGCSSWAARGIPLAGRMPPREPLQS